MRKPWPFILTMMPALAFMVVIFLLSHQTGSDSGRLTKLVLAWLADHGIVLEGWFRENAGLVLRKVAHMTEYGILLLLWLWPLSRPMCWPRYGWWALGITVAYAASDEFHQTFIPNRVGQISDVLIDSTGALLALGLFALIRRWRKKSSASVVSRVNQTDHV